MPGSQHCAYFSKGWNTKRSSRGVGADGSRAPWTAEHPELWPAGALSVGCKDMLGEWRAANKTKYWYSYTSGTGYCCSEHPTCQSSLWSSSGKHCLFYHPIPFFFFWEGEILSLSTSELRTGFWERDGVSMSADDSLKFRHGLCCCQSSPRERGYLTLFIPLSFLCGYDRALAELGCWARGNFGVIQDDHSNSFLWAHSQSSKQGSETWFSFAEPVLIRVSHITIFQVFYYSLLNSCFDHLQCGDAMLTGLNIG